MELIDETKIYTVHENQDILALYKPAGILTHPDGRGSKDSVWQWIKSNRPELENVGEVLTVAENKTLPRCGLLHRLDQDTSGVILVAKNEESFFFFKEQFQNRLVKKEYKAFVYGKMPEQKGIIDRAIGKSAKDFRKWSAQRGARGKIREAVTEYFVEIETPEVSLLTLWPKTGRTHQIRVHLKALHHPVVCDKLYAPNQSSLLGFSRLALHARSITIDTPEEKNLQIVAPYPKDFQNAKKELGEILPINQ